MDKTVACGATNLGSIPGGRTRKESARLPASGGNHILILGEENFLIIKSKIIN